MKKSDKKFIESWEKTRAEGFKKYALTHGLGFGILMTIFNLLFLHYGEDKEISVENFLTIAIVMILVGGFAYAGVSWLLNEYIYKKKTQRE